MKTKFVLLALIVALFTFGACKSKKKVVNNQSHSHKVQVDQNKEQVIIKKK